MILVNLLLGLAVICCVISLVFLFVRAYIENWLSLEAIFASVGLIFLAIALSIKYWS